MTGGRLSDLTVSSSGDLYYVATSQYGAIQKDGSLAKDKLQPPVVLRLALAP